MNAKFRERIGWWTWSVAIVGFATCTACIPSCNIPIGERERPRMKQQPVKQTNPDTVKPPPESPTSTPGAKP